MDESEDKRPNGNDDDEDFGEKISYELVPMIKDDYDYLYYVIKKNNELLIMEGNPMKQKKRCTSCCLRGAAESSHSVQKSKKNIKHERQTKEETR